jgi:hypothetical protein
MGDEKANVPVKDSLMFSYLNYLTCNFTSATFGFADGA